MHLIFLWIIVLGYLLFTIFLANQAHLTGQRTEVVKLLLYGICGVIFFLGMSVLLFAASPPTDETTEIGNVEILLTILVTAATTFLSVAVISSYKTRQQISDLIRGQGYFDPVSTVHMTAVVLSLFLLAVQILLFVMSGSTSGMAESIESGGISLELPVIQALAQVAAAVIGVGYGLRRNLPDVLRRLNLRIPTTQDWLWGIGGGLLLYVGLTVIYGIFITILIGIGVFSTEDITAQNEATNSLANAFATFPAAFILSASAAIGEETLFRGALQPVFGIVFTSVLFALLHTQALFSPGIFLLFGVSLGFGWLRMRYSTTASIIAHFTYNFIQLLILILVSGVAT